MRIFLLRLLLGWWMIIFVTLMIPFFYLLMGWDEAVDCWKEACCIMWNGDNFYV